MAWDWNNITGSDTLSTWLNGMKNSIKGFVNAFDGSNLVASSVALSKLAKQKARHTWALSAEGTYAGTSRADIMGRRVLNSDGATATYKIVGWSLYCGTTPGGGGITKGAGNLLTVKYNGSSLFTIDLNSASFAIGTPIGSDLSASPYSLDSSVANPTLTVDYTYGGVAGSYPGMQLCLDVTLNHAGT